MSKAFSARPCKPGVRGVLTEPASKPTEWHYTLCVLGGAQNLVQVKKPGAGDAVKRKVSVPVDV